METIKITSANQLQAVAAAVEVLQSGGLVLFPTETTYGAGVDACSSKAVKKLLAYKSRREGKPLSIAVTDLDMAQRYVEVNEQARILYRQFLPGPVTVVSRGLGNVAPGVESEFGTLGVRIPDYSLVIEMVKALGRPITATSANASGEKRPYTVEDVLSHLSQKQAALIDLVLDAGRLPERPPSTVIDTTLATPVTLRQGDVLLPDALAPTGATIITRSEAETKQLAGQLLLKHWDDLQTGPVVIGLDGPLGAGKTVFTKGIAEFLKIADTLVSPTYTYLEEYPFARHQTKGMLYHFDLWKMESAEQLERLEITPLLKPHHVLVIEWWSQVAETVAPFLKRQPHTLISCSLTDTKQNHERAITVRESDAL